MVYETNIDDWKDDVEDRKVLLLIGQAFNQRLKEEIEGLGSEDTTMRVDIEHYYSNNIRVTVQGMPSVLAASQMLSRAAQLDPPPLKLRFRGASRDGSCEIPRDEWYLTATIDDDNKVQVDLHMDEGYHATKTARYNITAYCLPVPGYLYGVRETESAATIREEEERGAKAEKQRLERNARMRANRAAAKRRREEPAIEAPPDMKPMLLGPKELSLCKDSPENMETPQLEDANV